jgi:hypothetical protein
MSELKDKHAEWAKLLQQKIDEFGEIRPRCKVIFSGSGRTMGRSRRGHIRVGQVFGRISWLGDCFEVMHDTLECWIDFQPKHILMASYNSEDAMLYVTLDAGFSEDMKPDIEADLHRWLDEIKLYEVGDVLEFRDFELRQRRQG